MMFTSDEFIETLLRDCFEVFNDSRFFVHLLLAWVVSLVFCWKVLPVFSSAKKADVTEQESKVIIENVEKIDLDATQMMLPPRKPNPRASIGKFSKLSPELPVKLNESKIEKETKKFLSQLEHERSIIK